MQGEGQWAFVGRMRTPEVTLATAFLVAPRFAMGSVDVLVPKGQPAPGIRVVFPSWRGVPKACDARVVLASPEHGVALMELGHPAPNDVTIPGLRDAALSEGRWTSWWFTGSEPMGLAVDGELVGAERRELATGPAELLLAGLRERPLNTVGHAGAPMMVDGSVVGVFGVIRERKPEEAGKIYFGRPLADFLASQGERFREALAKPPAEWARKPEEQPPRKASARPRITVPRPGRVAKAEQPPAAAEPEREKPITAPLGSADVTAARAARPAPPADRRAPRTRRGTPKRVVQVTKPWVNKPTREEPPTKPRVPPEATQRVCQPARRRERAPTAPPQRDGLVRIPAVELVSIYEPTTCLVEPFRLQVLPVTCTEYAEFLAKTGHPAPVDWLGNQPPAGQRKHPITDVRLSDAREYARWRGLRLPTHLEWEAAMRGSDERRFPWGIEWDPALCHCRERGVDGTAAVGSYPDGASPFGCLDMVGNVWEWTELDPRGFAPEGKEYAWVFGGSFRHACCQKPRGQTAMRRADELGPGDTQPDAPLIELERAARSIVAVGNCYPYLGFRCVGG